MKERERLIAIGLLVPRAARSERWFEVPTLRLLAEDRQRIARELRLPAETLQ